MTKGRTWQPGDFVTPAFSLSARWAWKPKRAIRTINEDWKRGLETWTNH